MVAADLMSDVLVDARPGYVLVTGLANVQVVRTAAIADLAAVVFARGKVIPPEVLELARESSLPRLPMPALAVRDGGPAVRGGARADRTGADRRPPA